MFSEAVKTAPTEFFNSIGRELSFSARHRTHRLPGHFEIDLCERLTHRTGLARCRPRNLSIS